MQTKARYSSSYHYFQAISSVVKPMMLFFAAGLLILSAFRLALFVRTVERAVMVDDFYRLFLIGLRMDTILLCYLCAPLLLGLVCLPSRLMRAASVFIALLYAGLMSLLVFCETATFPFMAEFDSRPDRLFIEHMLQAGEVFDMVRQGYAVELLIALALMLLTGVPLFLVMKHALQGSGLRSSWQRLVLLCLFGPLLFLGARSSIGHRPANIATAAFSKSHLVNQLGLNSTYSLAYACYSLRRHEKDPARVYGTMEPDEIYARVSSVAGFSGEMPGGGIHPLLHVLTPRVPRSRPCNLVIIMQESLGAEYVGCLGGLPLTPEIDRLSGEGLLFTRLYATGTRTVRGIEAIISGFLPTPGPSVVKLGLSQQHFFTLAELLLRRGYESCFIYGGDAQFDNMRAFFLGNGFQRVYDRSYFKQPVFVGTWGVSDEDLFSQAHSIFLAQGDAPFFALILTTSNHDPFEFPDGRIELYEQPKQTRHNAMKYADSAVGRFFAEARLAPYYSNTVFLIIADHSTRLRGEDLIPVEKFHVPAIMIGPDIASGTYDGIASQIDMAPTLLDAMGLQAEHPVPGRSLLQMPGGMPGRAIMQYGDTHAYLAGDHLVIHRPGAEPLQFVVKGGRVIESALDAELARDALAHALLPGYLYYNRLYGLPEEAGETDIQDVLPPEKQLTVVRR